MHHEDLDIKSYLRDRGVPFWDKGKNISQDWIGIQCLWCDDHSNHLGINLPRGTINCHRCPITGTVIRLIMKIDRCDYPTALEIIVKFNRFRSTYSRVLPEDRTQEYEHLRREDQRINVLSQFNFTDDSLPIHEGYLKDRYFDPLHLKEKYKIKFCGPVGMFKLRVIIPVLIRGKWVSFTARDVTEKAQPPYLNCPNEKSIIDIRDTIYNIDNADSPDVLIVEGVTDVWNIGDDVVATLGIKYTPMQVLTLSRYRRCFILYDAEDQAQIQAEKLSKDLSTIVSEVIRLQLPQGDPADLSDDDVKSLRKQIFGRIY